MSSGRSFVCLLVCRFEYCATCDLARLDVQKKRSAPSPQAELNNDNATRSLPESLAWVAAVGQGKSKVDSWLPSKLNAET